MLVKRFCLLTSSQYTGDVCRYFGSVYRHLLTPASKVPPILKLRYISRKSGSIKKLTSRDHKTNLTVHCQIRTDFNAKPEHSIIFRVSQNAVRHKIYRISISICTYLEVDAAGVAHERLAEGDATLLAANDAALEHKPVLVDLRRKSTDDRKEHMVIFSAVYNEFNPTKQGL